MSEVEGIRGFHAHVYFDATTRPTAERIHDALTIRFGLKLGALLGRPSGPHPKGMFEVSLAPEQFATVVTWLMMNRAGLSILVHPNTDDPVADHDTRPLWMGEPLPIDVELLRRYVERRRGSSTRRASG